LNARWPALLAACGAAGLLACAPSVPRDAPAIWSRGAAAGFDLLVVTLDTTRADRLGAYGYAGAETPHLDRLAAEGFRFSEALTVAPVTLPAHASIWTGRLPPRHGVRNNAEFRLGDDESTLAEILRDQGYATAAFVSSFVLDRRYGLSQGFERYDDQVEAQEGPAFAASVLERRGDHTADSFLAWLATQQAGQKLFAWVHFFDPHAPYAPPPPFRERFEDPYDGEIAFMDQQIGRLLAGIAQQGRTEKTLVVVVGDHGEGLGEHGERQHAFFVYDSTMRVPLIVHAPKALGGPALVDGRVVSSIDLLPTLLELLAIRDPSPDRDGESWVGRPPRADREVYLESLVPYYDFGWAPLYARRGLRDKAILAPRRELYDLADDPGEAADLFPTARGDSRLRRDALFQRLEEELSALDALPGQSDPAGDVPDEEKARLQALGYLGGAGPAPGGKLLDDPKDRIGVHGALADANAALAAGRPDLAERLIRPALALSPRDRSALLLLGKLHLGEGRLNDAKKVLEDFSAVQPRSDVAVLLAQIALRQGDGAAFEHWLALAEQLEPAHGGIEIARGDAAAEQGDREAARRHYERASERDPRRAGGMATARLAALQREIP
jgi:choline-sulfatase